MITDIGMPDIDGWELAQRVKNNYPEVKIAVLSGWNNDIHQGELEKYGVLTIVQKPISKEQLRKTINKLMS